MQQDLVGYLLGALDSPEQDEIRDQLLHDNELRLSLSCLEERLAPFESLRWEHEPPEHLTAATCALVAQHVGLHAPRVFSPVTETVEEPAGTVRTWRWMDMAIAATVLAMFSGVLSPAVYQTRENARIATCSDQLRGLGMALPAWAERMDGWLPHIAAAGKAGVAGFYGPQLNDAGLVESDTQLLCPDSSLAGHRNSFVIPSVQQVFVAQGAHLLSLQRQMGGSYNYSLGYVSNGRHAPRRFTGLRHNAVLGDQLINDSESGPHGKSCVNILFEDGHVRLFILDRRMESSAHEYYFNDNGQVEAGTTFHDIVLAPSDARPFPGRIEAILLAELAPTANDEYLRTFDFRALNVGSVLHGSNSSPLTPWYQQNR